MSNRLAGVGGWQASHPDRDRIVKPCDSSAAACKVATMATTQTDAQVRFELGISRSQVARWARVTDGAIARHESGDTCPLRYRAAAVASRIATVYAALRALSEAVPSPYSSKRSNTVLGQPSGGTSAKRK